MPTSRHLIHLCATWLLALGYCLSANAATQLNGVAPFQQLGKDRFVAGLYTSTLSENANDVIGSTQQRSMELRITADTLSHRRLNRVWIEGMAINNPSDLLTKEAENMVAFSNLLTNKLVRGDQLRLDYTVGQGTTVSLNGSKLGVINSDAFFDLLLRTWIGSIPLSSTFKDQLLAGGNIDDDNLALYNSIIPDADRQDIVSVWQEERERKAAAEKAKKQAEIAKTEEAIAKPSLDIAPKVEAPNAIQAPTVAAASPKPTPPVPTPPKPEPKAAPAKEPANVAAKKPAPDIANEDDEDLNDEPALTAEIILERQRYHSQLLKWCYKYLRYPQKAVSRGQQGSIRLLVAIDRNGNVTKVTAEEESKYSLLNKEALNAIERANPFPQVPSSIKGEQYSFTLPIVFKLPD